MIVSIRTHTLRSDQFVTTELLNLLASFYKFHVYFPYSQKCDRYIYVDNRSYNDCQKLIKARVIISYILCKQTTPHTACQNNIWSKQNHIE